jgi:murein L,D-transpeptidase YcbB/YkuD
MYYATLNPYWYVPTDLARKIIAPRVLKDGQVYLTDRGYEVIDRVADDAKVLPWDSVDWKGVAAGTAKVYVRQDPGPYNSMGHLKFNLARADGIYMHDTPHKELFDKPERTLSNGCVRLQDADRLAHWMLGDSPKLATTAPDQHVALPRAVPVKIAYLDANAQMQLAGLQ